MTLSHRYRHLYGQYLTLGWDRHVEFGVRQRNIACTDQIKHCHIAVSRLHSVIACKHGGRHVLCMFVLKLVVVREREGGGEGGEGGGGRGGGGREEEKGVRKGK